MKFTTSGGIWPAGLLVFDVGSERPARTNIANASAGRRSLARLDIFIRVSFARTIIEMVGVRDGRCALGILHPGAVQCGGRGLREQTTRATSPLPGRRMSAGT